jgi:ABC-type phosphate transport system substrate-binding protein
MRKLFVGATFLLFGAGAASNAAAALALKGSDTLEDVARDVIAACPSAIAAGITYLGGGSGGGEAAMIAATPTQQIAPMSRELSGTSTTAGRVRWDQGRPGAVDRPRRPRGGRRESARRRQPGEDGSHLGRLWRRDRWRKVRGVHGERGRLRRIGHLHVHGLARRSGRRLRRSESCRRYALTINEAAGVVDPRYNPPTAVHKVRNPARINCASLVRQNLVNSWGTLFADVGATSPLSCRTGTCVKLKHAFRRGDLSGTTDTFNNLVGLITVPGFTTTTSPTSTLFPGIDGSATANPFCNAGDSPMNKGDSDYLDLDPIRRIADSDSAANLRTGLEQVAEGWVAPSNPPAVHGNDTRADSAVTVLTDKSWSNFQNLGVDSTLPGGVETWRTAVHQPEISVRRGLGLVLPVEIPTNYADDQTAYWSPAPGTPTAVVCAPGVFAPSLLGANVVCPDGTGSNLCLLPVDASGTNFNCISDKAVPAPLPLRDARVFNLLVLNAAGKFVKDNYLNPNLTLSAARQNRVVSAYFRLHTNQVTDFGGHPTVVSNPNGTCKTFSSTNQIGCLVRSNPCSIGFAGREAVDAGNLSVAFQIGQNNSTVAANALPASQARIENLVTLAGTPYPIARKLWVNAYKGLANVTNTPSSELDLLNCFGANGGTATVDASIVAHNFIKVPNGVGRIKSCPATFP